MKVKSTDRKIILLWSSVLILAVLFLISLNFLKKADHRIPGNKNFSGMNALNHAIYQVESGPRIPGSEAHDQIGKWIYEILQENGWSTEIQSTEINGIEIKNIIGKVGEGKPWIIIGAHYDSRIHADRDPDATKRSEAVPGANDGASGVGILLEYSRIIPEKFSSGNWDGEIWLVFLDGEDNG